MTTTTDLALIDSEGVEQQELTKSQAKALDKKIRSASDRVQNNFDVLLELLEQAFNGSIHKALELPSWTAYVKDAAQINVSDRYERKALVALMSGKGISTRAIAGALGVSQMTVVRDSGETNDSPGEVTGLDGKTYTKPEPAQEPIDVEYEEVDDDAEPMKAVDIVEAFADETANLWAAFSEMHELTEESKWDGARKRVAKANLNSLQEIITGVQQIIDDLMEA